MEGAAFIGRQSGQPVDISQAPPDAMEGTLARDAVRSPVRVAVVPAAGLGTRLLPATLAVDKELLPLGLHPAIFATLLEAEAAGIEELVVVLSPGKERVRRFLSPAHWEAATHLETMAPLLKVLSRLSVRFVEQLRPCGSLDAIERGLVGVELPCAVLYPDLVYLPDQRGLVALLGAHARCGEMVFGLYQAPTDEAARARRGPSARAILAGEAERGEAARDGADDRAGPRRIVKVEAPAGPPTAREVRTTFGYIHTEACTEALERACRPESGAAGVKTNAPLDDRRYLDALNWLASAGTLYGVMLPGEVLDLGVAPGYLDAARRFAAGEAHLRGTR